jgi:hypothetical protein
VTPQQACSIVKRLEQVFQVVPLDVTAYHDAIERCANRGFSSGAVFDALHLIAAEHHKTDGLLTFNVMDFQRLATPASPRIIVPPDPPAMTL